MANRSSANALMLIAAPLLLSVALRLLLLSSSGYRSTDFEVHRNWLAITSSIPLSKWYIEATSIWTLDYPPLFAYFEYLISLFARPPIGSFLFRPSVSDARMLDVNSLDYAPVHVVFFQRLSVVVVDALILFPATVLLAASIMRLLSKSQPPDENGQQPTNKTFSPSALLQQGLFTKYTSLIILLILSNVGVLIIDHIHFQYNGFLIGILFYSIAAGLNGQPLLCALFFSILIFLKHIFGYMFIPMALFLLQDYCFTPKRNRIASFSFSRFFALSFVLIAVASFALLPFIFTHQLHHLRSRLFPFGRGLVHSYWAPNFWSLYLASDRLLSRIVPLTLPSLPISTELKESISAAQLPLESGKKLPQLFPIISPRISLVCTLLFGYFPLIWIMIKREIRRRAMNQPQLTGSSSSTDAGASGWKDRVALMRRLELPLYLSLGNYAAFLFGFHTHEKAILYSTLPLTMLVYFVGSPQAIQSFFCLNLWSNFSLLPLLPHSTDTPLKLTLWGLYSYFEYQLAFCYHQHHHHNPPLANSSSLHPQPPSQFQPAPSSPTLQSQVSFHTSTQSTPVPSSRRFPAVQVLCMVVLIIYQGLWRQIHQLFSSNPNKLEFLPLLLTSCMSTLGIFTHMISVAHQLFSSIDFITTNADSKYD